MKNGMLAGYEKPILDVRSFDLGVMLNRRLRPHGTSGVFLSVSLSR